ncbi:TetR family transcriptional regulator [Nocardioides sambongensis]|uniref:TetR family transcriptional regulator n=1 Tax=Nocardioides sambongensis TaxID=2589074 RepID=UPI001E538A02|nr:TetR family transcriptional regulator [Nocardioides sambongensis]
MARYRKVDVVDRAIGVLDDRGLDDLSMRNVAAEMGVRPSALYHHFASKQALLDAVADRILELGRRATEVVTWDAELRLVGTELRDAMLGRRDGAILIAGVHALGGGAREPQRRMEDALRRAGADEHLARVGARTLLHFVFGHVAEEQIRARSADGSRAVGADAAPPGAEVPDDFAVGLGLVLGGLVTAVQRNRGARAAAQ